MGTDAPPSPQAISVVSAAQVCASGHAETTVQKFDWPVEISSMRELVGMIVNQTERSPLPQADTGSVGALVAYVRL